jgi:hypothetical protein
VTLVGLGGLLISIVAALFAFPQRPRDRYILGFGLLALHLAATVVSFLYDLSHDADARGYYFDPYGLSLVPNSFGTVFLVKSVQAMRHAFGGSYFEYFLLFQTFGFAGIVLLSRVISDIQSNTDLPHTKAAVLIFFLPSMHFWTSAIGKDAPLFFASSMAAWTMMKFSSRWVWFVAALCIMVVLRPHIALVSVIALMLSLFLDKRYEFGPRLFFFVIALVSSVLLVSAVGRKYGFSASNPNSVADFITSVHNTGNFVGGSNTNVHGGFFVRLLSLLFRPFFFDSPNIFGIISSFENVIFLFGLYCVIANLSRMSRWFKAAMYAKYSYFFTIFLTLLLAAVYYNIGLGLRQRVMVYPTLLPIFVIGWAIYGARRRSTISSLNVSPRVNSYELSRATRSGKFESTAVRSDQLRNSGPVDE